MCCICLTINVKHCENSFARERITQAIIIQAKQTNIHTTEENIYFATLFLIFRYHKYEKRV